MHFITEPNLPAAPVCLAVVDGRIGGASEDILKKSGMEVLKLKPHKGLYRAVESHPDMMLHHVGGNVIVHAPGTDPLLLRELEGHGFRLVRGESELTASYPQDIAYNAARVGRFYFHHLKYTDPQLRRTLVALDIEPVHVEQGYTKCSILPLSADAMITMDAGIARAAEKKGFEVLLLENERGILLPGLDRGFIGGTGGMISANICALNGRATSLDNFEVISSFLHKKGITLLQLSDESVTDIGSILPLKILEPPFQAVI